MKKLATDNNLDLKAWNNVKNIYYTFYGALVVKPIEFYINNNSLMSVEQLVCSLNVPVLWEYVEQARRNGCKEIYLFLKEEYYKKHSIQSLIYENWLLKIFARMFKSKPGEYPDEDLKGLLGGTKKNEKNEILPPPTDLEVESLGDEISSPLTTEEEKIGEEESDEENEGSDEDLEDEISPPPTTEEEEEEKIVEEESDEENEGGSDEDEEDKDDNRTEKDERRMKNMENGETLIL
jgi:hypothetical protein